MTAPSKVSSLLGRLMLEEKASLRLGSDILHTAAVERLGIPAVMVSTVRTGCERNRVAVVLGPGITLIYGWVLEGGVLVIRPAGAGQRSTAASEVSR